MKIYRVIFIFEDGFEYTDTMKFSEYATANLYGEANKNSFVRRLKNNDLVSKDYKVIEEC